MSLKTKKYILTEYFRKNGGVPKGAITIDSDENTVGNVSVNGTWYGTFDYEERRFIETAF